MIPYQCLKYANNTICLKIAVKKVKQNVPVWNDTQKRKTGKVLPNHFFGDLQDIVYINFLHEHGTYNCSMVL